MTNTQHPFTSITTFREQFNLGLCQLLDKQQLGTFILCLANASNDPALFKQFKTQLKSQYINLLDQIQTALNNGEHINAVERFEVQRYENVR
ncbi:hypothetical protein MNBD_GAMMA07-476 [hydrothermal vent metagenome]|uniref:Uncharacterized protein n=1 Tax=hydrothermal vent metagenome TaxID=652676 RepID=A0A3B0XL31_9ZZZZ